MSGITNMMAFDSTTPYDLGPRFLIHTLCVPIVIGIASWLTWTQKPRWARLFASAYWLPQYFLMPTSTSTSRSGARQQCRRRP